VTRRRALVIAGLASAVLLGAAAPGEPPDYPVKFISVDQLKADLDRKAKVLIVDVRTEGEFAETHIKGARSIPLRTVDARATKEIPKNGRVVLY
jgi:3-mercaptopyruvate sulfurtransferase SseA